MKWLIDEQSVILNEVLVLVQKSIHFCEHAVDRLEDEDLKALFRQEWKEFNVFLPDLIDFFHMKGELTREPDSEKEAFEQWKIDIKALLSKNGESSFLYHYVELQQNLLSALVEARMEKGMPEGIGGLLKKLDQHVSRTLSLLEVKV